MTIPTINMEKTGENIARLRKEKGISLQAMQEIFGFHTPQAIMKWQKGINLPTVDNLLILAELFQIRMDEILVKNENTLR